MKRRHRHREHIEADIVHVNDHARHETAILHGRLVINHGLIHQRLNELLDEWEAAGR